MAIDFDYFFMILDKYLAHNKEKTNVYFFTTGTKQPTRILIVIW